jgi:hypothetical protein
MRQYVRCAKWLVRSGNLWILLTFAAVTHNAAVGLAATAYAECVDDAVVGAPTTLATPPAVRLSTGVTFVFRVEPVRNWQLLKVTMLLHVAGGPVPAAVDVGPAKPAATQDKGEGWFAVELPLGVARKLVSEAGSRLTVRARESSATIHTRESHTYSPYLVIDGASSPK